MSLPPVRAPGKRLRARQREAWPRANPGPKDAARGRDPHLPARPRQAIFGSLERGGRLAERENQQLYSEAAGKFLADRFVTGTCPFCAYEVRPCPRPGRPRARDALAPACMRATPSNPRSWDSHSRGPRVGTHTALPPPHRAAAALPVLASEAPQACL